MFQIYDMFRLFVCRNYQVNEPYMFEIVKRNFVSDGHHVGF